jgi:hypothetical protein
MTPWNQLLESLHSSLIDELVDRINDTKPELGLPKREAGLLWPDPSVAELLVIDLTLSAAGSEATGSGQVFIGLDPHATQRLNLAAEALWQKMLVRAKKLEFPRRKLAPHFASPRKIRPNEANPGQAPSRVIWIPFGLLPGRVYLGVGI